MHNNYQGVGLVSLRSYLGIYLFTLGSTPQRFIFYWNLAKKVTHVEDTTQYQSISNTYYVTPKH